eukprot:TRINITY_DN585_c0_g1_i2.p2 TRINITY_DN585_c0_g1~~TRINITY_DN585_c0_g1_i2.p2  ORF type:complete len:305 (+),score=56.49 TRINITY_DN585_c0_g1_i2:414-1328(+)
MEQRAWVASEKKKLRLVVSNMSMLNDLQQDLEDVIGNVIKMAKELQPDLLVLQGVVHHNPRRRSGDKWGKWRHSQPHTLTVTETSTHSPPSQHPLSIVDILSRELGLKFIMYGSSDFRGNAILSKCPITQCSNFGVPWEECGWGVVRITVQTEFKESEGETSGKEDKPKEEISRLSYFGGHRGRSHSYGGDTLEAAYTNIGALMGVYCTYMDGVHGQLTLGQVSKILNFKQWYQRRVRGCGIVLHFLGSYPHSTTIVHSIIFGSTLRNCITTATRYYYTLTTTTFVPTQHSKERVRVLSYIPIY